ncbi:MAG: hypothetical protein HYY18_18075 [Planctomycetes bacterium]|nr:hypothetical protein [Planctomycetota bacterium]
MRTLPLACALLLASCARTSPVASVEDSFRPLREREAILILPGFVSRFHGNRAQQEYFSDRGYDLFIPDCIARESLADCLSRLEEFMAAHRVGEYRRVHVFAYIVGGWVLNAWIAKHRDHNIASIVYDRSPLQERAPGALIADQPWIARLLFGGIVWDMARTPYPPMDREGIRVGLLVECKATAYIRRHRESALAPGPVRWDFAALGQRYDDAIYIRIDHDELYSRFDQFGAEVLGFFVDGRFSRSARRRPFDGDPFE